MKATLAEIEREDPQCHAWLKIVGLAVEELRHVERWADVVPEAIGRRERNIPLLAAAPIDSGAARATAFFDALLRKAGVMPGTARRLRSTGWMVPAVNGDDDAVKEEAAAAGLDPERFLAVSQLAVMPFLHAFARRWLSAARTGWSAGYCPVCGAWPAFAEMCGVPRSRLLRCRRCGSAWHSLGLSCPFCETADRDELALLLLKGNSRAAIEACKRCQSYVKTFSRLHPIDPSEVMLDDLASMELDLSAVGRGYHRR